MKKIVLTLSLSIMGVVATQYSYASDGDTLNHDISNSASSTISQENAKMEGWSCKYKYRPDGTIRKVKCKQVAWDAGSDANPAA